MIDRKLIDAYQWVVDASQKKPGWWAEQVMIGTTVIDIMLRVTGWNSGWDAVLLLMTLMFGTILIALARNEAMLETLGSSTTWIRPFFLGVNAFQLTHLIMAPTSRAALQLVSGLLFMSFYYFAACENPRPKKRKEKLVLNHV
ncbi:hypothetical protein [Acinetobacter sp.]|uniref:hypothetical protein n=1 Tax=Acinetobacter sp. TaxID=472 RepID=UPI00388D80C0